MLFIYPLFRFFFFNRFFEIIAAIWSITVIVAAVKVTLKFSDHSTAAALWVGAENVSG